jgi:hypothetical protein
MTAMGVQERIQHRHWLLEHLVARPDGVAMDEIPSIGAWAEEALGDLLYLKLAVRKKGRIVVPEKVVRRLEQLEHGE